MAMKTAKTAKANLKSACSFTVLGLALATFLLMPDAYAIPGAWSQVGAYICSIAGMMDGTVATGIATIGIATIGILALVGRVTWTQAIIVGAGCVALFGAYSIALKFDNGVTC